MDKGRDCFTLDGGAIPVHIPVEGLRPRTEYTFAAFVKPPTNGFWSDANETITMTEEGGSNAASSPFFNTLFHCYVYMQ